jgi:DNA-directed RNA polymerase subunit RPC12/RpoP
MISATLVAIRCPECGATIVLMTTETDGFLVGECGVCGAKVEKRRGEPEPRIVNPS